MRDDLNYWLGHLDATNPNTNNEQSKPDNLGQYLEAILEKIPSSGGGGGGAKKYAHNITLMNDFGHNDSWTADYGCFICFTIKNDNPDAYTEFEEVCEAIHDVMNKADENSGYISKNIVTTAGADTSDLNFIKATGMLNKYDNRERSEVIGHPLSYQSESINSLYYPIVIGVTVSPDTRDWEVEGPNTFKVIVQPNWSGTGNVYKSASACVVYDDDIRWQSSYNWLVNDIVIVD